MGNLQYIGHQTSKAVGGLMCQRVEAFFPVSWQLPLQHKNRF